MFPVVMIELPVDVKFVTVIGLDFSSDPPKKLVRGAVCDEYKLDLTTNSVTPIPYPMLYVAEYGMPTVLLHYS